MKSSKKYTILLLFLTSILYFIGCSGSGSSGSSINPPTINGTNPQFTDTDFTLGEIGGVLTFNKATDETNIDEYRIYWGSSSTTKLSSTAIVILTVNGSNQTYTFAENTTVPSGAVYFLIYSANSAGEINTPLAFDFFDFYLEAENAQGLSFRDTDMDEDEITGDLNITKALDESNVTEYRLYWGSSNTEKLTGQTIITSITPTGSDLTYSFTGNSAVPSGAVYLLLYSFVSGNETTYGTPLDIPDRIFKQVYDINSGSGNGSPYFLTIYNNKLYFSANNGTDGNELWLYDDNVATSGTNPKMLSDINSGSGSSSPSDFIEYNNILYFRAENDTNTGQELWYYDGTNTPSKLTDINNNASGDASPQNMVIFNSILYFLATDDGVSFELWQYDDQSAIGASNPQMIKDIYSIATVGLPSYPVIFNSKLYFQAYDPTNSFELWSYTGSTAPSIVNNYNINPGSGSAEPTYLTVYNNNLYFNATDGTNGKELWKYTGSGNPALILSSNGGISSSTGESNPQYMTVYNSKLYFSADGGDGYGKELWVYDSTKSESSTDPKNPSRATDINPTTGNSSPGNITFFNNKLFFSATDATNGIELWEYDETDGAQLIYNLNSSGNSSPDQFKVYNNKLFMRADGGSDGSELWVFYEK